MNWDQGQRGPGPAPQAARPDLRLKSTHRIEAVVRSVSGLRIGAQDTRLEIGTTDNTVLRNPLSGQPFIPGSSLKGKLRSEWERRLGKTSHDGKEPCNCAGADCFVCRLFGPHKKPNHTLGPTRVRVRDGIAVEQVDDAWVEARSPVTTYAKPENMIQRNVGVAGSPRDVEVVAAGTCWRLRIDFDVLRLDDAFQNAALGDLRGKAALQEAMLKALAFVIRTGIGAGLSKGYGELELVPGTLTCDGAPVDLPAP